MRISESVELLYDADGCVVLGRPALSFCGDLSAARFEERCCGFGMDSGAGQQETFVGCEIVGSDVLIG